MARIWSAGTVVIVFAIVLLGASARGRAPDPDALWKIVHDKCVPGEQQNGNRAGAEFADGRPGFIVLTDHVTLAKGDKAAGEELQDHACALAQNLH